MKALTALILACLAVSVIVALPVKAIIEPSVGVKEGDWIEYNVNITGNPPAVHRNVTSMRLEVLQVAETAFSANVTVRYANGTSDNSIWQFNFTEGNTGGWIIIPANLSPGDAFYDAYSKADKNITIQNQEQKTVLGASRIVTYGNDSYRQKQWDKATGVFVGSSEVFKNWSAYVIIAATNLWSPQIEGVDQAMFYGVVSASALVVLIVSSAILIRSRRKILLSPFQRKVTAAALLTALLVIIGAIAIIPLNESQVPLGFREINLIMQSLWTALVIVSMWFRRKGNYLVHGILMLVVVSITVVSFSAVLVMSPPGSDSMQTYFSSLFNLVAFIGHAVLSIPAIAFGVWLVALWRPRSTSFPSKSKKAAQLTTVFWVLSYVVGVLDFLVRTGALV
jgi:uncharacterized membrane protein YozB (DUF420 family)